MWEEVEEAWRNAYVAPSNEVGLDIWKRVPLAALPDYPLPGTKTLSRDKEETIPAPTEEGFFRWRGTVLYPGMVIEELDTAMGTVLTIRHPLLDKKGKRWWTR